MDEVDEALEGLELIAVDEEGARQEGHVLHVGNVRPIVNKGHQNVLERLSKWDLFKGRLRIASV